jgi:hypothetical protein
MPNQTKALIAIVSIIILVSGIFVLTKSRPAEVNLNSNVTSSSVLSSIVNSVLSVKSSISSQLVSSSSQSEIAKVVEAPKVENPQVVNTPKLEVPKQEVTQSLVAQVPIKANLGSCEDLGNSNQYDYIISTDKECFRYSYLVNVVGKNYLSPTDEKFIKENINDVAIYYHNSVRSNYPTIKHYVKSLYIQKLDDNSYIINFSSSYKPLNEGSTESQSNKTYKLIPISSKDGEFEEVLNYQFPQFMPSNSAAVIAPPGYIPTGGHD